jgi:hypothetical protein
MPQSLQSIYLKIFTGYLQLVTLTTQLDLDWPQFVLNYFQAQSYAASLNQQVFSVDCYLASDEGSQESAYFGKVLILAIMPALLGTGAVACWAGLYYFKRDKRLLKVELVATLVVLFFLVHPSLVKEYFDIFNCRRLEGQLWLNSDLSIRCFDAQHTTYAIGVALPAIIVWGIGVPSFILGVLVRRHRLLYRVSTKARFGFLYNGFKRTHFYWEFLILYRKILIISLAVFLGSESVPVQALSVMVILVSFLFLQYWQEPYTIDELNKMELRAILTASITIYCGLYYLTQHLGEGAKIAMLVVMVVTNCYFLYFFLRLFTASFVHSLAQHFSFLRRHFKVQDAFPFVPLTHDSLSRAAFNLSDDPTKFFTLASQAQTVQSSDLELHDLQMYYEAQLSEESLTFSTFLGD